MTSAGTPPVEPATSAVLYVCAERGATMPGLAAQRAEGEGHAFARHHGLTITEVVTDRYGVPDPCRREGWQRIRSLARAGAVTAVPPSPRSPPATTATARPPG